MEAFQADVQELLTTLVNKPTALEVLFSLAAAIGLTLILWTAYRLANKGSGYQPKFAATLVSLAVISTVLMNLIQSNLALSLGMLGSLSIVRFRTTIRDPRDIGFIFWSMAIGLAASTGNYVIGIVGSLVLGVFMVVSARCNSDSRDMMLVIRGSSTDLQAISKTVEENCTRSDVRAKNVLSDSFELVYDVYIPEKDDDRLIDRLFLLRGIDSVNLLAERKTV